MPENMDRAVQLKLISRKMVHNLNNTLAITEAYAEMIRNDPQGPKLLENVNQIETAAGQAQRIMRDWRVEADKLVPDPDDD